MGHGKQPVSISQERCETIIASPDGAMYFVFMRAPSFSDAARLLLYVFNQLGQLVE
jgi:hypothetical protein